MNVEKLMRVAKCRRASRLLLAGVCFGLSVLATVQAGSTAQGNSAGGFRIAGTVVSKTDGHPLAYARVVIRNARNGQRPQSAITADDGKFEFTGVPAGKYGLEGAKRGFITSGYDQHEFFWTAIVTGAGLDTENLVLKVAPDAVITGRVLDEAGEPVRRATVMLYYDDHTEGVDQIHVFRNAETDDQGMYEVTPLKPGTYFLSASGKPWYARHSGQTRYLFAEAGAGGRSSGNPSGEPPPSVDRSLDVAYPTTYYADATDAESAAPILIRGGERLQFDLHLNPVPAISVLFRVASDDPRHQVFPRLEQPAFDGAAPMNGDYANLSPGVWAIEGIPAGRYNVRLQGQAGGQEMNGIDLTKDGEEIDASKAEELSRVKISAQVAGESSIPEQLSIGLRTKGRMLAGWKTLDAKGEAELNEIPPGKYEIVAWGPGKQYSVARVSAEGAETVGRMLVVTPGSSPSMKITLATGTAEIEGMVKRDGKGFAGAMVVLVPKDPEQNHDLFRRDQSDLDGSFAMRGVVPGTYRILAIENGWDLDWSQPGVIAAYGKHARTIEVGSQTHMNVPDAVEVVAK